MRKRTGLLQWCRLSRVLTLWILPATFGVSWFGCGPDLEDVRPASSPEELVYSRSEDDIVSGGVLFTAPTELTGSVAVIWIHGWGVNFYYPTYVGIGRALADRGYPCISGNTRMHDIGNVAGYRWGKRIRGGGYWGVASEEIQDIAGWVDFAESRGFQKVILVGHSAGWAAVRAYQFERQDPRVVGMVLASGMVWAEREPTDPDLLEQAKRLVGDGRGDDLLRLPGRSFPSFVSASTFLDIHNTPQELYDFFGVKTPNPGITRIRCPVLAFFGTDGDVGDKTDLELLESAVARQSVGPSRVDTRMIEGADHMYAGEEEQVARTIADWADLVLSLKPE